MRYISGKPQDSSKYKKNMRLTNEDIKNGKLTAAKNEWEKRMEVWQDIV